MSDTFIGISSTAWAAIGSISTTSALLATGLAAYFTRGQWQEAIKARHEAGIAAREAARPYVIITLEPSPAGRPLMDITVRNIGKRPAHNVRITTTPELVAAWDEPDMVLSKARLFTQPTSMIAPNQEIRVFFDHYPDRDQHQPPLPTHYDVSLHYTDSTGTEYSETAVLETNTHDGSTYIETYGLHDMAKALRDIRSVLKKSAVLSDKPSVSVITESRAEHRDRKEQEMAERRERIAQLRAQQGRQQ